MSMQYLDLASAGLLYEGGKRLDLRPSKSWGSLGICEDLWICKSHDFRLSFVTSSDYDPKSLTGIEEAHLEDIENRLETAQLWKQLGLQPSLLQEIASTGQPFESSRREFVLGLRDDHSEESQDQVNVADVANLRAPDSVKTIHLVSVLVSLRFEALRTNEDEAISTTKSQDPLAAALLLSSGGKQCHDDGLTIEGWTQGFEPLLDNNDFGPWTQFMNVARSSRDSAKRLKSSRRSVSMATLLLADLAFRSLICPRPTRPFPAIISREENSLFNLANLAPAVFIPGYRDAVQSRAKLIPTIAKFLCQFLRHAQAETHSADIAKESSSSVVELSMAEHSPDQKDTTKQHLWMTLTNGVKNVELARKLKPLRVGRAGEVQVSPSGRFEDVLNTWHPCEDDTVFPLDNDFEDLHLDEERDLAENDDEHFSDLYDEVLSTTESRSVHFTRAIIAPFDDEFSEEMSCTPSPDRTLNARSDLARSTSWYKRALASELERATACPESNTGKGLQRRIDSSDSQLTEATQSCVLTTQSDVIGENGPSHDYVSRIHPSHVFENDDGDNFEEQPLLLEQPEIYVLDEASAIWPISGHSIPSGTQDIIDIADDQYRTLPDNSDHHIEMPLYEKSNGSSLTDIIGIDLLLWQMWTKRRPSMIPTDDDMLEMHTMYAHDPDMRLLETHKELDNNDDCCMLDSEPSNTSTINSQSSRNEQQEMMLSHAPTPAVQSKHHHPFHLRKEPSPTLSQTGSSRPTSRERLRRGQAFIERLSGARASVEEAPSPSTPFIIEEPQDDGSKFRKTLATKSLDCDDMLLR